MLGEWAAFERHYGPLLIHERVDFGFAALRAVSSNGRIADHLPPWYERPGMDDEALWGMLESMSKREFPKAPER